jgi:hypothetical protein
VRVGFKDLKSGEVLGCGDPTGNGTDEPILLANVASDDQAALATTGCRNEVLVYRNIRSFDSGLIVPRTSPDFPLVVAVRDRASSRSSVDVQAIAENFKMPRFNVPDRTLFSLGVFPSAGSSPVSLVWQELRTRALKRIELTDGNGTVINLGSSEIGFDLVGAQFVGRLRGR